MTAPIASGWSEFAGWGLHPLESAALPRRTPRAASCPMPHNFYWLCPDLRRIGADRRLHRPPQGLPVIRQASNVVSYFVRGLGARVKLRRFTLDLVAIEWADHRSWITVDGTDTGIKAHLRCEGWGADVEQTLPSYDRCYEVVLIRPCQKKGPPVAEGPWPVRLLTEFSNFG